MIRRIHPPMPAPRRTATARVIRPARTAIVRLAGLFVALAIGSGALTGCGTQNTETECGLDSCLVTFDRGVEAEASVLGVRAKLVGADTDTVTVEVAGEQISLSTGQQAADVGGLYVSLEAVNDQQAVVRIGRTPSS